MTDHHEDEDMDYLRNLVRTGRKARAEEWRVAVPCYDNNGVVIDRFTITEDQALHSELRALFNPQRANRSLTTGTFTKMVIDGVFWMSDTPAEVEDLLEVDDAMGYANGGSMLIVGLGLGLVLNRAIKAHDMSWIDVVEREPRVIEAVGPYYRQLALDHDITLNIHQADIHRWRIPQKQNPFWDVAFFDIWPTIDMDDLPEVTRLKRRFGTKTDIFLTWAQEERLGQKRRIKRKEGWY